MDLSDFFSKRLIDSWESLFQPGPFWRCFDRFEHLDAFAQMGNILTNLPAGVVLKHPEMIFVGEHCNIDPGVTLQGPCIIADHVELRPGAYVRERSYIGPYSVIGHGTEVKGSFLFKRVKAAHFSYVGDSLLGERVNLGAGTICANVRLDKKEVYFQIGNEKVFTGRKKLGAIIGDQAQVGCNVVLNPGALVGKQSKIPPLTTVKGTFFPKNMQANHAG